MRSTECPSSSSFLFASGHWGPSARYRRAAQAVKLCADYFGDDGENK